MGPHDVGRRRAVQLGRPGVVGYGTAGTSPWSTASALCPTGVSFGGWGYPTGFMSPWWAGMPLPTISANTGGTWPWAPFYWTPQWWTYVALANSH